MIDKIKQKINSIVGDGTTGEDGKRIILIDPGEIGEELLGPPQEELRVIGLFSDVHEEKIAELVHALLFLDKSNNGVPEDKRLPVEFYLSTYGGNADDMFALYDVMKNIQTQTEIHTIGLGKVMSAGVLLLAAGTKGKRKIGKNCRVMLHSVIAGNHGSLHNLINEMEAVEQLQNMYTDALLSETKMTQTQLKKMLERKVNVYLSAEEAIKYGIADKYI